MPKSILRRPMRAFLLTPAFFVAMLATFSALPILTDGSAQSFLSALLLMFFFGLPIAYLNAIMFGLPVYLWLKNTKFEKAIMCVFFTAILASIVYFFLEVDLFAQPEGQSFSIGDNKSAIIKDNVRTFYGWKLLAQNLLEVFIFGAISGLVFWRLYSGKWWEGIDNT